jgi:hypothetical protein
MKTPTAPGTGRQGQVANSSTNSNTAAPPLRQRLTAPFGPWSPDIDPVERTAQLRSLAALAAVLVGSHHPLVAELRKAETDPDAAERALALLDGLPSLTRRRLITTFGAITFRPAPPKLPPKLPPDVPQPRKRRQA